MNPKPPVSTRRQFLAQTTAAAGATALLLAPRSPAQEPRSLFIEGYTGQTSYAPGDDVTFHISTSAPVFTLEIARIGQKTEVVWTKADVPGAAHAVPEHASSKGCGWPVAVTVKIPPEWRSGFYQVTLRAVDGGGNFVQRNRRTADGACFFVVRSATPGRDTKMLLQLATNTYNAYNNWGGTSLYAYNGRGNVQGHRVSFDRPPLLQFFD